MYFRYYQILSYIINYIVIYHYFWMVDLTCIYIDIVVIFRIKSMTAWEDLARLATIAGSLKLDSLMAGSCERLGNIWMMCLKY